MVIPFKILAIRDSERDAGCRGTFFRAWDVFREIMHSGPSWITVSTSGVQEHCRLNIVRVATIRHRPVNAIDLK
jgi:hypothetical protein